MSNPFAALFEDVDRMSDPILADTDLSDPMFAPMEAHASAPPSSPPLRASGAAAPAPSLPSLPSPSPNAPPLNSSNGAVHEMLLPPMPRSSKSGRAKAIQQALVVTWDTGDVPDLMELNDLLASGWRVATTAGFPTAEGARGSLLVVVEQEMPG